MSKIYGFRHIENKHTLYREKDCLKKICDHLREHAKNIIAFEKKKKNVTTNKRGINVMLICKSMLYLQKQNPKKVC